MKKKLLIILTVCLLAANSFNTYADDGINQLELHNKKEVILQLDSKIALVDGKEHPLETIPKVIEGSTYLPLRFMSDKLLEAGIEWDAKAKKVTIIKKDMKVEVTIDSKDAYVNGDQIQLTNAAIIDKGTTYLPLRAMADLFEIQTDYDPVTKKISLVKIEKEDPSVPKVKKPIASFMFDKPEYTAGQTVWAVDNSFHEDGQKITNKLWMVNFNEKQTNSHLENMFSKPVAGTYSISLKVEADPGNWSDWVTKQITINPNKKPVVTSLTTDKDTYAGGEPIEFSHTYENEEWEGIKAERWTYRQSWEAANKTVVDKPTAIFHEGHYVVTLQLQDDYNNWSDAKEIEVIVTSESKQSELEYRFLNGKPGDIIDNFENFNYQTYEALTPRERNLGSGTLMMSNSPENVKSNGILYTDTLGGEGRILLHHFNGFTAEENQAENKKIILVAENPSNEPVTFTIYNKIAKGPSTDILFVGQQLLYDYLKGAPAQEYTLQPGERISIYDSGSKRWEAGQIVSVQMDFSSVGNVKFTTACVGKNDPINVIDKLPTLKRDAHPRGTFYQKDLDYKIHLDEGEPRKLVLGANENEWVMGYDRIDNSIVRNKGNFAVNYRIEITAEEDMGVILNPRAGVFRGALKWDDSEAFLAPSKGYFMGHNSKGVLLGVIKAGETRTLKYSLPNGSGSPVLLVFIPKDQW